MDVRNRTWPVCPWDDPIGTRGDFNEAALVPALTKGSVNVSTTPAGKDNEKCQAYQIEMFLMVTGEIWVDHCDKTKMSFN